MRRKGLSFYLYLTCYCLFLLDSHVIDNRILHGPSQAPGSQHNSGQTADSPNSKKLFPTWKDPSMVIPIVDANIRTREPHTVSADIQISIVPHCSASSATFLPLVTPVPTPELSQRVPFHGVTLTSTTFRACGPMRQQISPHKEIARSTMRQPYYMMSPP